MARPQVEPGIFEQRLREIEARIDTLQTSAPANFDAIVKALTDQSDVAQTSGSGLAALAGLEQRVGALADKLANFEARSDRQAGADRRIDELLDQLTQLRAENERRLAAIRQQMATDAADAAGDGAESIRRDVASLREIQTSVDRRTQDTFEAVYGTIEQVVDRLGVIENELRLFPRPAQTAILRHPAAPNFDAEGSPGWGENARRAGLPSVTIDRIAGSVPPSRPPPHAGAGTARAGETAEPVRAKFVAAARRAAGAASRPLPRMREGEAGENAPWHAAWNFPIAALHQRFGPRAKSVMLGVSMALLVLGGFAVAVDLFHAPAGVDEVAESAAEPAGWEQPAVSGPGRPGANLDGRASPAPVNATAPDTTLPNLPPALPRGVSPDATAPPAGSSSSQTPAAPPPHLFSQAADGRSIYPPPPAGEAIEAASLPTRNVLLGGAAAGDGGSQSSPLAPLAPLDLTAIPLPPTVAGRALLAAALVGDPAACYEIGIRFAQGRDTAQDFAMAAAWLERAARGGLAPAEFRLAILYEKGLGVKKDLAEARRLYAAAADKGHAKAMYNLAVLYAGGLDGRPDYALASQWFGRAAAHGVVDGQYNLAILYARGLGIERNFAESYKWFALAAKSGDKDAARKRDEVAARLDPKQLESAKLNVEAFLAVPQPDEATAVNAPGAGSDQAVAAEVTNSKAGVRPERFPAR